MATAQIVCRGLGPYASIAALVTAGFVSTPAPVVVVPPGAPRHFWLVGGFGFVEWWGRQQSRFRTLFEEHPSTVILSGVGSLVLGGSATFRTAWPDGAQPGSIEIALGAPLPTPHILLAQTAAAVAQREQEAAQRVRRAQHARRAEAWRPTPARAPRWWSRFWWQPGRIPAPLARPVPPPQHMLRGHGRLLLGGQTRFEVTVPLQVAYAHGDLCAVVLPDGYGACPEQHSESIIIRQRAPAVPVKEHARMPVMHHAWPGASPALARSLPEHASRLADDEHVLLLLLDTS